MKQRKMSPFYLWITGFMVLAAVCTFFSRTIYNYNLPTVTLAMPRSGKLDHDISGNSYVTYQTIRNLYAAKNGRIGEILVSAGDRVGEGQVLMRLETDAGETEEISAPAGGVVTALDVQAGMYVMASQNTVLVQVAELSGQWSAELSLDAEQAGRVAPGREAVLEIRGVPGTIRGTVESVRPDTDGAGYIVSVAFESPEELAGKPAEITLPEESEDYEVIIANCALHRDSAGYYVLTLQEETGVLGDNYVVVRVSVDLLDGDDFSAAILGLPVDTPVIVSGTDEPIPGMRVVYEEGFPGRS